MLFVYAEVYILEIFPHSIICELRGPPYEQYLPRMLNEKLLCIAGGLIFVLSLQLIYRISCRRADKVRIDFVVMFNLLYECGIFPKPVLVTFNTCFMRIRRLFMVMCFFVESINLCILKEEFSIVYSRIFNSNM